MCLEIEFGLCLLIRYVLTLMGRSAIIPPCRASRPPSVWLSSSSWPS